MARVALATAAPRPSAAGVLQGSGGYLGIADKTAVIHTAAE